MSQCPMCIVRTTVLSLALALAACAHQGSMSSVPPERGADAMAPPNQQMKAVLDELAALGAKPVAKLSVEDARRQPTPADAVKALLRRQGKSTAPEEVGRVENRSVQTAAGPIPVRIYMPKGSGPFPVVLYIHGGGWVIADIDTYDSSARALTNAAQAIVVSTEYRHAPEHKFPAAHDDTYAVYRSLVANARTLNGDPARIAVVGESAGGNMAAAIALRARDEGAPMPLYQVLIYPVTEDQAYVTPSERENINAKPLDTAMLRWFYEKYLRGPADGNNPYFSVLRAPNLKGLPPATVITAGNDPLRSEGRAYAERLQEAGVPVDYKNYASVTHEFFGMGAVLDEAKEAVAQTARGLRSAFR